MERPVFRTHRIVEFRDTDAAGIVHFSAFFPMMEAAEHEFLRSVGISVMPPDDPSETQRLSWPRVAANCQFHGAARFEDQLQIDVFVDRIGNSSVSYRFEITCNAQPIATGLMTVVCCDVQAGGKLVKTNVPDHIRTRLLSGANDL